MTNRLTAGQMLGKVLRERREEIEMTQKSMAARANISAAYLSLIEAGKRSLMYSKDLLRVFESILRLEENALDVYLPPLPQPKQRETKIGRILTERRLDKRLTLKEVGDLINATASAVVHYELGSVIPSQETLEILGKVLEFDPNEVGAS